MNNKKYAIIDIETTGGMSSRDKITEIGIVIHDGHKVIDQYETLINPGRSIPANITGITGITNQMVANAPRFHEVAKKVVEMTEGTIFVAHNVRFDYGFIKHAFAELGYTFTKRQLCTVRLSRKAFPGLSSYSLGNLINHFDIHVDARHRALDDAKATAIILEKILRFEENHEHISDLINEGIKESRLPKNITIDMLHDLPEDVGVYYFFDESLKPIYIGKSINIKKRVMQHFSKTTKKAEKLQRLVHSISYELTGSELASLVYESIEIKKHQPIVNKTQRTTDYPYFIHQFIDDDEYICFQVLRAGIKNEKDKSILGFYSSKKTATGQIAMLSQALELCEFKSGLTKESDYGACYSYHVKRCKGACVQLESADDYNQRAMEALPHLEKTFKEDFILIDKGRSNDEKSVFLVQDSNFMGYGYISFEGLNYGVEEILESINYLDPNPEMNRIVRNYIIDKKYEKKMKL